MRNHVRVAAKRRMLSTTALVAAGLMISSAAHADPANSWDYDVVLGGNVGKDTSVAGTTDIYVQGGNGYVAGNADIYSGHTVNVVGDSGSTFAYHDNRNFIPSTIRGALNSNMNIIIIDNDGMFFTETAVIDVQSLVATTGFIAADDIMDGDGVLNIFDAYKNGASIVNNGLIQAQDAVLLHAQNVQNNGFILTQAGGKIILAAADQVQFTLGKTGHDEFTSSEVGMILNTGTMDAGEEGLAAIIAPFQENTGVIRAKMGNIVLAAQDQVTLDYYGDGLVEVAVDGELADALITNRGTIEAEGGVVNITAKAAKNTVDNLINNEGLITASSATVEGGKIILGGGDHGTIRNKGTIETNEGGSVDISGERFVQGSGAVAPAFAPVPPALPAIKSGGANINIATSGDVEIYAGTIDAEGGNVEIANGGTFTSIAEAVKTSATGTISLTQNEGGLIQNAIDAIDNTGSGDNTVNVGAGTYNEAVVANVENLNLKGANAGVHGNGARGAESIIIPNSPGVHVTSDNVTVDGFEIVGGDSGVFVEDADNATIVNNNIHGQTSVGSQGNLPGGIASGDAVIVVNSTGTTVDSNNLHDMSDEGVQAWRTTDLTVTNNRINDTTGNGDEGILVSDSDGKTLIDGNYITGTRDDGIRVERTEGVVEITDNTILYAKTAGIVLDDVDHAVVDDNKIGYTNTGIRVTDARSGIIGDKDGDNDSGNIIHHAETGIRLNDVISVDVVDNNIFDVVTGISVKDTLAQIGQNAIEALGRGVHFTGNFEHTYMTENVIFAGDDGILFEGDITWTTHLGHNIIQAGGNGIAVKGDVIEDLNSGKDGLFLSVSDNTIFAKENGVLIDGNISGRVNISGNHKIQAGTDGIHIEGDLGLGAGLFITDNKDISAKHGDGIEVINTSGDTASVSGMIVGNFIHNTGDDGVRTDDVALGVYRNDIIYSGGDGIDVSNSGVPPIPGYLGIDSNKISYVGGDGIKLDSSDEVNVRYNTIYEVGGDGIDVSNSDGVNLSGNVIGKTGDNGIEISGSDDALVYGNKIAKTGRDGINVNSSNGIEIYENTISYTDADGIDVNGSHGANIHDNGILLAKDNGIELSNSRNADIVDNNIGAVKGNGIDVDNAARVDINDNEVFGTGEDGIHVEDSYAADIKRNKVGFAGDDGIDVDGSAFADIKANEILVTRDNGIEVSNSRGVDVKRNIVSITGRDAINVSKSAFADINNNTLSFARGDGIEVNGSRGVDVNGNEILLVGDNGIEINESDNADVKRNKIGLTGGNGIEVSNSDNLDVRRNTIAKTGDDGIDLNNVYGADVAKNNIAQAGDDGIDVDGGSEIFIEENNILQSDDDGVSISEAGEVIVYDNIIAQSGDDGVDVEYTGFVEIDENTITESEDDGVDIYATSYALVTNNDISDSGDDGIHIAGNGYYPAFFGEGQERASIRFIGSSAKIENNEIENSGGDGIQIENLSEVEILDNTVNESGEHGLYVSGAANGYVQVQGNDFTDNGDEEFAQARFESGDIDLSDLTNPNTFTKTTSGTGVAMQFEDITAGFDSPIDDFPSDEIFDTFESKKQVPYGTGLRIVEETLGSTEFTGYTGAGNFYVRLEDGSILDPITNAPIVIDGTNASFDGIVPANFANTTLPLATLQFIEDRLYDADDSLINGRGQIFVGFVETINGPANFQDFLPQFQNGAPLTNLASVTIRDLPSIGNFGGGAGDLNNIAPAAGGEGNEGENLSDIEPSAGGGDNEGTSVTCLEDAVGGLGAGAVTYNFGGSFEDSLANASGCQSSEI